jgi:hypothetical protein
VAPNRNPDSKLLISNRKSAAAAAAHRLDLQQATAGRQKHAMISMALLGSLISNRSPAAVGHRLDL